LNEPSARFPAFLGKYLVADATDPDRTKKLSEFPYLDAAGFYAPERISELQQFFSIEPLVLRYLKQNGATRIEKAGENLRVTYMTPERTVTVLLDPKLGFAVAEREEWTGAGKRIVRIESQDFKYYEAASIWLPSR